jgi:REP element-mobilizing transposase RayT
MSFVRIWIHAVWRTKHNGKILLKEPRKRLFAHIKENAKLKKIYIDSIDGSVDHVHCLMGLNRELSIAGQMKLIKGESAFWANQNHLLDHKLEWGRDYYAVSVSESLVGQVRKYIWNQEQHHKDDMTYETECNKLFSSNDYYEDLC